jgi:hypothetical protein
VRDNNDIPKFRRNVLLPSANYFHLASVALLRCEETSHKHKKRDETSVLLLITLGDHNERNEKDGRVPRIDKRKRRV